MIGQRVGSYVIESQLGAGGMGAVYRARHVMLGRMAAIKVLLPQFSASPEIVQRFFNEARAATEIRHMGIVEIFDFGQMEDGSAYIAMEMLDGESLASRMRSRGSIGVVASLRILRQMCGPLGAAHDRNIVHRDLKPDNVFIVADPEVVGGERIKLLDFGIAKVALETNARQTSTGAIMGTPIYMSPEQCRGVAVDLRADIYALGCILFELIRQHPPFLGEGVGDIMGGHMFQPPPPLGTTAPELDALVARLLAKQPAQRPQTTREVADSIDRILAASPAIDLRTTHPDLVTSPPHVGTPIDVHVAHAQTTLSSGTAALPSPPSRGRWAVAAIALVAIAGAVVAVMAARDGESESTNRIATNGVVTADARDEPPAPDARHEPAAPDAAVVVADAAPVVVDAAPDIARPSPSRDKTQHLVVIKSVPSGASVQLAGSVVGTTPFTKAYPPGRYSFTVTHAGYVAKVVVVDAATGGKQTVKLMPVTPVPETGSAKRQIGSDDAVNPFGP